MQKAAKMTKFKKAVILSKLILTPSKTRVHLQYVNNMSAKFEKHSLITVREVDSTNSIPYSAKKLPK